MDEKQGYEAALALIERARRTNAKELSLSDLSLSIIPEELFKLKQLQVLDLSQNNLINLPVSLFNITELRRLDFRNNKITALPAEITNLVNLIWINASTNLIQELPVNIWDLNQLREINLANNKLQYLPPGIGNLANLRELQLINNPLSELPLDLGKLRHKFELAITGCPLVIPPPDIVAQGFNAILGYLSIEYKKRKREGRATLPFQVEFTGPKDSTVRKSKDPGEPPLQVPPESPETIPPREPEGRPKLEIDELTDVDRLGRQPLIESLAAMLENPSQETPITLAILGNWGEGKSNLFKLLEQRLKGSDQCLFRFAKFDAWEYELTDNIAAGLAQEVVKGNFASINWWQRFCQKSRYIWERRKLMKVVKVFLTIGCIILASELIFPLLPDETIQSIGKLVIWVGAGVILGRNWKEFLDHPIISGVQKCFRLPEYKKHLGMIPVIKEDIDMLTSISLGVRGRAKKLHRMVVFVDNLDRCSHETITKTLDAIRLIMDIENTYVIIGMDPRIALRAVAETYRPLAGLKQNSLSIARDYLGKIIQIPIILQKPSDGDLEGFVSNCLFPMIEDGENILHQAIHSNDLLNEDGRSLGIALESTEAVVSDESEPSSPGEPPVLDTGESGQAETDRDTLKPDLSVAMTHTEEEMIWLYRMVLAFDARNPRQTKRLFNSYCLLKLLDAFRFANNPTNQRLDRFEMMRMLFLQDYLHGLEPDCKGQAEEFIRVGTELDEKIEVDDRVKIERVRKFMRAIPVEGGKVAERDETSEITNYEELSQFVSQLVLPCGGLEA